MLGILRAITVWAVCVAVAVFDAYDSGTSLHPLSWAAVAGVGTRLQTLPFRLLRDPMQRPLPGEKSWATMKQVYYNP